MKNSTVAIDTSIISEQLEKTFSAFCSVLSKFTASQINEVSATGSWTAGQVAEHIIKATNGIPDSQIQKASRPYDEQVEKLRSLFLNMHIKMQSPDFIIPEVRSYNSNDLFRELENNKRWLINIINCKALDEVCMDFEVPTFGFLTRYEWIQFINFHVQRHTIQIEKILSILKKENS